VTPRNSRRRRIGVSSLAPLVVFAASFFVHLAFFWLYFSGRMQSGGDTPVYAELSNGFFSGSGMTIGGVPSATYPPVYPAFFAALTTDGRPGMLLALTQLALSASIAGAVWSISRRRFGRRAAFWSSIAAIAAPQLPFWAAYALSDTLGASLGIWSLWAVNSAACTLWERRRADVRSISMGAIGGTLFALSVLSRPLNAPALILTAGGLLGIRPLHRDVPSESWVRRKRARSLASVLGAFFLAAMLPIGVWTTRNAAFLGSPIPLSTRTGWQLWQGVLWDVEGRGTVGKDVYYPDEAAGMTEVEADRYLVRRSMEEIGKHPGRYVQKFATKVAYLWLPTAPGLGPGMLLAGVYFLIVAAAAALPLGVRRLRAQIAPFWLGALGVSVAVGTTILDPDYRYRLFLLVVLLVPAGAGFELLSSKIGGLYSGGTEQGESNDG
jgi:hypothetical protein